MAFGFSLDDMTSAEDEVKIEKERVLQARMEEKEEAVGEKKKPVGGRAAPSRQVRPSANRRAVAARGQRKREDLDVIEEERESESDSRRSSDSQRSSESNLRPSEQSDKLPEDPKDRKQEPDIPKRPSVPRKQAAPKRKAPEVPEIAAALEPEPIPKADEGEEAPQAPKSQDKGKKLDEAMERVAPPAPRRRANSMEQRSAPLEEDNPDSDEAPSDEFEEVEGRPVDYDPAPPPDAEGRALDEVGIKKLKQHHVLYQIIHRAYEVESITQDLQPTPEQQQEKRGRKIASGLALASSVGSLVSQGFKIFGAATGKNMMNNTASKAVDTAVMALRGGQAVAQAVNGFYTLIAALKTLGDGKDTNTSRADEIVRGVDTLAMSMGNVNKSAVALVQRYGPKAQSDQAGEISHVLKIVVAGVRTVAAAYRLVRNIIRTRKVNQYLKRLKEKNVELPNYMEKNLGTGLMPYISNIATLGVNAFNFINGIRTGKKTPTGQYKSLGDFAGLAMETAGSAIDVGVNAFGAYKTFAGNDKKAERNKPLAESMVNRMKQRMPRPEVEELGDFYDTGRADGASVNTRMLETLDDLDVEFFSGLSSSPRELIQARSNPEFLRVIAMGFK